MKNRGAFWFIIHPFDFSLQINRQENSKYDEESAKDVLHDNRKTNVFNTSNNLLHNLNQSIKIRRLHGLHYSIYLKQLLYFTPGSQT